MLNLEDLAQFVAFHKCGTLTKVAEEFLISQPTITRNMKRLEEEFGIPLFIRSANKLSFTETGDYAAQCAEELLVAANQCVINVQNYDQKLHTITIESCAPAPLWNLIPSITRKNPDKTISSKLEDDLSKIEENILNGLTTLAILPHPMENEKLCCEPFLDEHLSICVPKSHALAKYAEVSTSQINGYNCLLASEIGFWNSFCKRKMPSSKFLVQTDEFAFRELIRESTLPYFTTDLSKEPIADNRISIPITDDEANVTYFLIKNK
ncbi:LysR family transcriptional regulator [Lachnospira pectinoschiza]|uniref:DNA-binding transcriptional regulator, LysR family n=1 Tax=Lachnospira pectinoschiza TaxID=28052 RepID=A0A1G9ZZT7_9FIRM|nr:LysR family transcriptional regulator [Lachnospira pectinoschiza]SDN27102.1 DNA-binding transcriptional regulator, LysR family [Lachnospira pectinoschiza]